MGGRSGRQPRRRPGANVRRRPHTALFGLYTDETLPGKPAPGAGCNLSGGCFVGFDSGFAGPGEAGKAASQRPAASAGRIPVKAKPARTPVDVPDFELVFHKMPGLCLVLDPAFTIIAQNEEHARATRASVVGQMVFAAFPDNPGHAAASGVARIRDSLLKVLKTREADHLPMLRYDIQPPKGAFETRHWSITNIPILGEDGYVRWILLRAEEVTELVRQQVIHE
jgi:hypothetical protein